MLNQPHVRSVASAHKSHSGVTYANAYLNGLQEYQITYSSVTLKDGFSNALPEKRVKISPYYRQTCPVIYPAWS